MKKFLKYEKVMQLDLIIVNMVICYAVLPRGFCTLVHSFIILWYLTVGARCGIGCVTVF